MPEMDDKFQKFFLGGVWLEKGKEAISKLTHCHT